jgi:predicted RNA-binding protein YlxR (DUF448 family)/ribosomal protein L30E
LAETEGAENAPEDTPEDVVADEKGPLRRCIVTGAVGPKEGMIRFVVGPDRTPVPDLEGRLPGRGIWLSAKRDVVNTAVAKAYFAKAARQKLDVPADLADRLETLLRRRCLDILGLARRAGQVVSGYDKVRTELKAGRGAVILAASDGAEDGVSKIGALAPTLPVVRELSASELGAAFGRDHTVHGVMLRGRLASLLLTESARLAGIAAAQPRADAQERE